MKMKSPYKSTLINAPLLLYIPTLFIINGYEEEVEGEEREPKTKEEVQSDFLSLAVRIFKDIPEELQPRSLELLNDVLAIREKYGVGRIAIAYFDSYNIVQVLITTDSKVGVIIQVDDKKKFSFVMSELMIYNSLTLLDKILHSPDNIVDTEFEKSEFEIPTDDGDNT